MANLVGKNGAGDALKWGIAWEGALLPNDLARKCECWTAAFFNWDFGYLPKLCCRPEKEKTCVGVKCEMMVADQV